MDLLLENIAFTHQLTISFFCSETKLSPEIRNQDTHQILQRRQLKLPACENAKIVLSFNNRVNTVGKNLRKHVFRKIWFHAVATQESEDTIIFIHTPWHL